MEKRTLEITLETAKEWYKGDNEVLKGLALQAFNETELQERDCVRSWEEFCVCEKYNKVENEYYIGVESDVIYFDRKVDIKRYPNNDRNLLATKEDAEAVLAFIQLKRLRDQWWESLNWKPDYTNLDCKYTIIKDRNKVTISHTMTYNRFLIFPTKEIAEDFLDCFRDLIEKSKNLI